MDYKDKYIKYKTKYLQLAEKINNQFGGAKKMKKKSKVNINMIMDVKKYIENVSEPWFTLILLGLKTVEGRKNKGKFKDMKVGEIIEWTNNDFNPRSVLTKITKKKEYNTFKEYLETEGLDKCLPGISNIEDGLSVYFKYFTKEDEVEFGVIAITLELI
jgi:ASC-1-like (ASCH) protein